MKLALFLFLIVSVSCTRNSDRKEWIDISLPGDVSTLDPANCYDTVCYVPVAQIYESLYEIDYLKRPYSLRPLIAENMPEISKNRLKYTFKIKKGIKYHSSPLLQEGREVKAQDFETQLKRVAFQGTRSQGWFLFDSKVKGINEWRKKVGTDLDLFEKEKIPGVTVLNDQTLEIELVRPYPQLLWAMAMTFTAPVPLEAVKPANNDFSRNHYVGTGPYSIVSFNPTQEVTLIKNENYITSTYPTEGDKYAVDNQLLKDAGAKLPFVKNVKFSVIIEPQTDWLNFRKKKIDMVNLTKDHYHLALTEDGKIKQEIIDENIQLQASSTLIYWWVAFNMKDPILGKNLNLRKAIAHALDNDKFIKLFTYNIAEKANSIYPPGIAGYEPDHKLPYDYDIEKAKEYLKKAGYPEGKGLPELTYDVRGTDSRKRQMGEFVQQELRKIGIDVQVRLNTFPSFLDKSRRGELQFWQGGWVLDYPDAENVLQLLATDNLPPGPNSSQYSNPKFDAKFKELRELEDGPRKFQLMKEMENIVNADLPWSMQYYSRNYILYHNYLKNFRYSDIIYNNIKYLKLDQKN